MSDVSLTFDVDIQSYANATVKVTLSDERLRGIADSLGVEVADLKIDDLREHVGYDAIEKAPTICTHCSGWGRDWGMTVGDDWDIAEDDPKANDEFRSIRLIKNDERG